MRLRRRGRRRGRGPVAPHGWTVARRGPGARPPVGHRCPARASSSRKKRRLKKKKQTNPKALTQEPRGTGRGEHPARSATARGRWGHPSDRPAPLPASDTRQGPPAQQQPPAALSWPRSRGCPTLQGAQDAPMGVMGTRPRCPRGSHGDHTAPRVGSTGSAGSRTDTGTRAGTPRHTHPWQPRVRGGRPAPAPSPHPHASTSGPRSPPPSRPIQKTPFIPFSGF